MYNEREDSWPTSTTEFCLITPRSDACAAAINGKIYVAGELALKTSVASVAAVCQTGCHDQQPCEPLHLIKF